MQNTLSTTKIFGISFIFSFLSYGIGINLLESGMKEQVELSRQVQNQIQFFIGGLLVVVLHTLFNLMLIVSMRRILKPVSEFLAEVYLCLALFATLFLSFGAIAIVAAELISCNESLGSNFSYWMLLQSSAKAIQFYCYQYGMILWSIAGIALCFVLLKHKLIPKMLATFGIVAYFIFIIGTISELLGVKCGLLLSIPGGLFELTLSGWVILKGLKFGKI